MAKTWVIAGKRRNLDSLPDLREAVYCQRKEGGLSYENIARWMSEEGFEASQTYVIGLFKEWGGDPLGRKAHAINPRKGDKRKLSRFRRVIEEHASDGYTIGQIRGVLWSRYRYRAGRELGPYIREELGIRIGRESTSINDPSVTHNGLGRKH